MYLPFITDENLIIEVEKVLGVVRTAQSAAADSLYRNVLDPFSALFQSAAQGLQYSQWIKLERARQVQKTMQNAIGEFHQGVLGSVLGWVNLGTGHIFDIMNTGEGIVAEIKNKHNTVTGTHLSHIYDAIGHEIALPAFEDFTAYFVQVIPKNRGIFNKPFVPSDRTQHARRDVNERIRIIDGRSFYALVTGIDDALDKLYGCLPFVIEDISGAAISESERLNFLNLYQRAFDIA